MSSRPFGAHSANMMVWEAAETQKLTAIPIEGHRQIDLVLPRMLSSNWGESDSFPDSGKAVLRAKGAAVRSRFPKCG